MSKQSGQLLLEVLVAVVAVVAIAALGAQLVLVGQRSSEITGDKDTALKLVEETFGAVGSIATEDWQFVSGVTKGAAYQPIQLSGKWSLTAGSGIVTVINGVNYTRSFYIENVNRDSCGNGNITTNAATSCVGNPTTDILDDPSTQKIVVSVSWPRGDTVTNSQYITRWRGKGCVQTDWTTGGGVPSTCPASTYEAKEDSVNTSVSGEIKLQ